MVDTQQIHYVLRVLTDPDLSTKHHNPLRKCHVIAGLQRDLNNSGAIYVHLLAGSGVAPRHSACLVETVRLHSACIIRYEHLQHNWFTHTLQLGTKRNCV